MGHFADDGPALRLKADIWVRAYIRRCVAAGAFAALSRRGDQSAGAVFIEILHRDGVDLWAPAPMSAQRAFECIMEGAEPWQVVERMDKEAKFDSDLWLVTVEDRDGRSFLEDGERG
ncbi:MAG: DUF1491 family protein [Pseudomonadota bacterium]